MKSYYVKSSQLHGEIMIPASKSQSIRSILFASMAEGQSIIKNYLTSPDIFSMIAACRQLGTTITVTEQCLSIKGVAGSPSTPSDIIDSGNSGQVLRFIACLAGLQSGYVVITGDHSIQTSRPVAPLIEALPKLGMMCESLRGDQHAPLILKGPFKNNQTSLEGEDSQPVSGLLMTAIFMKHDTFIQVRHPGETPWVDLTLRWLDRFGVKYKNDNYQSYQVCGGQTIAAFEYAVPGDLSSLSFPLVAALITQSELVIKNVDMSEPQGDKEIVSVLKMMGANIHIDTESNQIVVGKTQSLHGIDININDFIDCVAILAVVGCYAEGVTRITGAAIARKKESDRITAIATELKKMGADIDELEDGLVVRHSQLNGAVVDTYHDHRIAMSLAVAGMIADGETQVNGVQCIEKSFPNFLSSMQSIGATIEES